MDNYNAAEWRPFTELFDDNFGFHKLDALEDGREFLTDVVSFRGESGEIREALEKIAANWPGGIFNKGKFEVSVGVHVKIKDSD